MNGNSSVYDHYSDQTETSQFTDITNWLKDENFDSKLVKEIKVLVDLYLYKHPHVPKKNLEN